MRSILAAPALLLLASTPASGQRHPSLPAAMPAGKPLDCLRLRDIRETRVRDDRTIDFVTRAGRVYRNTLDGRCPQLGFEQRFAYKTHLAQLCSHDWITVLVEPGLSRGASCGLGKFQPVTLAAH